MKNIWLLMPWYCLSFSLQACFCCRDFDSDSEYRKEISLQVKEKEVEPVQKAVSLVSYNSKTVSLEDAESRKDVVKDIMPTIPQGLALQRRRDSIDAFGDMQSPCKYMGFKNNGVNRRSSIMLSQMIDKSNPSYAFISQKYKEAIDRGEFDHTDPCAALIFINHLMYTYSIQSASLSGEDEEKLS